MAIKDYKPTTLEHSHNRAYVQLYIPMLPCDLCSRWMVSNRAVQGEIDIFDQDVFCVIEQLNRTKHTVMGSASINGNPICTECQYEKVPRFICSACKQSLDGVLVKQSFGNLKEHLCCICYEKMSAKQWSDMVDLLHKVHGFFQRCNLF